MMPALAFALKENLGGALGSKISESFVSRGEDEDSPATLRHSKETGVQSSPREAIPEIDHFTDESPEVAAPVGTE
jgi:hypothetical protein